MIEDLQYFCFIKYVRLCCLMCLSAATPGDDLGEPPGICATTFTNTRVKNQDLKKATNIPPGVKVTKQSKQIPRHPCVCPRSHPLGGH